MTDTQDGLRIARERITKEALALTGSLDLGMLGLDELPAELFALARLRRLNLGSDYSDEAGDTIEAASDCAPNRLAGGLAPLGASPPWVPYLILMRYSFPELT